MPLIISLRRPQILFCSLPENQQNTNLARENKNIKKRYRSTIIITVITSGETYRHHPLLARSHPDGFGGGGED